MKFLILILILPVYGFAQSIEDLLAKGIRLRYEYKIQDAFPIFNELLKTDSNNSVYLLNASYLYSRIGYTKTVKGEKHNYYNTAEYLAKRAIKLDPQNPEAHYSYILSIGRKLEFASNKEKINMAKVTKAELDLILKLNPKHAGAYQILGRWHRTVAGFNQFEKALINTFFGGVPLGTYEDAIQAFQNAIIYEPKYILHQYELAVTYNEMGKKEKAIAWLEKALEIVVSTNDDIIRQKNCIEMLERLKQNKRFAMSDYDRLEERHRVVE